MKLAGEERYVWIFTIFTWINLEQLLHKFYKRFTWFGYLFGIIKIQVSEICSQQSPLSYQILWESGIIQSFDKELEWCILHLQNLQKLTHFRPMLTMRQGSWFLLASYGREHFSAGAFREFCWWRSPVVCDWLPQGSNID